MWAYLSSTMREQRLTALALLSIRREQSAVKTLTSMNMPQVLTDLIVFCSLTKLCAATKPEENCPLWPLLIEKP